MRNPSSLALQCEILKRRKRCLDLILHSIPCECIQEQRNLLAVMMKSESIWYTQERFGSTNWRYGKKYFLEDAISFLLQQSSASIRCIGYPKIRTEIVHCVRQCCKLVDVGFHVAVFLYNIIFLLYCFLVHSWSNGQSLGQCSDQSLKRTLNSGRRCSHAPQKHWTNSSYYRSELKKAST